MRAMKVRSWDGLSDAMLDVGGYVLLAVGTALAVLLGDPDAAWRLTTVVIALVAATWIYLGYTRLEQPRRDHQPRLFVFWVGLAVLASVLMLRQPMFFIFMISSFFYAATLRPFIVSFAAIAVTSVLVNSLLAGLPQTAEAWTFWAVIIVVQTVVLAFATYFGERVADQNEERRETVKRLEQALAENEGLHAQLLSQAREAGVLEERQRMAAEIHDTIAQGLTGVITQLEAASHADDRPDERDRHLANAETLARQSLSEARRSVEGALPAALEAATLPDALREVAREWSERSMVPSEVTVTGEPITLDPEIEVTLLRTCQEALANVAKHARAGRTRITLSYMGDEVALDVHDDGVGFDLDPTGAVPGAGSGFGLHGMRQRVARVAGSVAIESEPGHGTAISARVPAIAISADPSPTAPR